ncbi:MAG: phosphoribosylformylglycinamidine cyclo-ligase [FCB group bacterium]|nr:phosphoribosylformylglycinamidine cyclo-ligase [FCB group bacterium]
MKPTTYKDAGVDIGLAESFLDGAKASITKTFRKGVLTGIGHFGAFFQPDLTGMEEPVLVSSTDGVGTKIKVAQMAGIHNTVGQDIVNHCVNDIMCTGAQPMYFLDYFAMGKMNKEVSLAVIVGICKAADENDVSVIGGETAEMPGLYHGEDYDLAGTIVGIVDKKRIIDGCRITSGDVMIALPSNGLHTNGFSLARKICFEIMRLGPKDMAGGFSKPIGTILLKVHRSYKKHINALMDKVDVKGISHITGGGIEGNTSRIIPDGLGMEIDWNAWERPTIFKLLQEWGNVPEADMRRTFNLGLGMIFIVSADDADKAMELFKTMGEEPILAGKITS